jgi:dTDP-glucose 4,6-dehydratase
MLELAQEILSLTNSNSRIIFDPLPPDDPKKREPDITKAKELLGWEPKISRTEGLKKTIEHLASKI